MSLTQYRRRGVYKEAKSNQARLTVTSAAEAFYQALLVGDFKQSDLETLAKNNATGIKILAEGPDHKPLPGMSDDDGNCTVLSLKASEDCSEIYAYLVTTIGTETERVKITFSVDGESTISGLFTNSCDFNGTINNLNYDEYGYVVGGGKKEDNFIVVRKGANMSDSTCNLWCNVVFTGTDNVDKFQCRLWGSDMVFMSTGIYSSTAGIDHSSDAYKSSWYFLGSSGSSATAVSGVGAGILYANSIVFANRSESGLMNVGDSSVYKMTVDASNSVSAPSLLSGSVALSDTTTIKNQTKKYTGQSFKDQIGEYPDTDTAFAMVSVGGETLSTTCPGTGYTTLTEEQFMSYANTSAGSSKVLGDTNGDGLAEVTKIKLAAPIDIGNYSQGTDITNLFLLDGTKNYTIYLSGSGTYGFYTAMFAVVNPTAGCKQVFVLEPGVNLTIGNENGKTQTGLQGFLSVSRDTNTASASAYSTYLFGAGKLLGEMTQTTPSNSFSNAAFSKYYDSVKQPTIFIFGAGSNNVKFCKYTIFEGYMGLFNPLTAPTAQSKITAYNNPMYLYGRFMANSFGTGDGGTIVGPYCPGPDKGGSKPDVEPYKFGYSVVSVDYYYVD